MTALTISNEEMNDIVKIFISPEESGLLIKGVSKKTKIKQKRKGRDFIYVIRYIRC